MSKDHACCPPGALGKANVSCHGKGKIEIIGDTRVYLTGDSPKTIIYIIDIFGLEAGHTQQLADDIANLGYTVAMPDIIRGDDYPDPIPLMPKLKAWVQDKRPEPMVKYVAEVLLPALRAHGKSEFAVAGSCFGVWVAAHLSSHIKDFKAGVGFHPSYGIANLQGDDIKPVLAKIGHPMLLFPAKQDGAEVRPGGELTQTLEQANGGKVEIHILDNVDHGFMNRGDLSNEDVRKTYDRVLKLTGEFLAKYV
jgi:dienelactone hydrolase